MKNKTTAGILALLLGGIGAHCFYLDRGSRGVLYFLFCWTFIPLFVSFFEGIILLTMSEAAFNAKYNFRNAPQQAQPQIYVNNVMGNQTTPDHGKASYMDELERLHGLMERGIISAQEFEEKKAALMTR